MRPATALGRDSPPVERLVRVMGLRWRWIAWVIVGFALRPGFLRAGDVPVRASDQRERPNIPAGLPRYEIEARLDLDQKIVSARERVRFTNRSRVATQELVLHV